MNLKMIGAIILVGLSVTACSKKSKTAGAGAFSGLPSDASGAAGQGLNGVGGTGDVAGAGGSYEAGSQEQLNAVAGDRVFFAYDSADLNSNSQQVLDSASGWLTQNEGRSLTIEGHADERGTRAYNIALGERRANAVGRYLISKGVSATRLSTLSFGKERPACVGSDEQCNSQNRRAVLVVK